MTRRGTYFPRPNIASQYDNMALSMPFLNNIEKDLKFENLLQDGESGALYCVSCHCSLNSSKCLESTYST